MAPFCSFGANIGDACRMDMGGCVNDDDPGKCVMTAGSEVCSLRSEEESSAAFGGILTGLRCRPSFLSYSRILNMCHWYSTHASLFSMESIGGSSFLSLSGQRKKRTNTLKGTGERKPPAILLGLAPIHCGGQLETRFAQTVELLNPPPFISRNAP